MKKATQSFPDLPDQSAHQLRHPCTSPTELISQMHQERTLHPTGTLPVQDCSVSPPAVWHNFPALQWMPFSITKTRDNSCHPPHTLPSFGKPGWRSSSASACSSESLLIQAGCPCLLLMSKTQDSGPHFENYIIQTNYATLHPERVNTSS